MCEFIRRITRFSLWIWSAAVLLLVAMAVVLLIAPRLLLQILYYGIPFLCFGAALIIAVAILRAALSKR